MHMVFPFKTNDKDPIRRSMSFNFVGKKLFENKIKFVATDGNMKDIWPNPKPASRFIPDEYKNLKDSKMTTCIILR